MPRGDSRKGLCTGAGGGGAVSMVLKEFRRLVITTYRLITALCTVLIVDYVCVLGYINVRAAGTCVHVRSACPCPCIPCLSIPCCFSLGLHGASPCSMPMLNVHTHAVLYVHTELHAHVRAAFPCLCCMYMPMIHVHVHAARPCPS